MQFADIIVPLNLPRTLTYGIPVGLQGKVEPGMRVEVSIGKNKVYAGIVLFVHNCLPDSYKVKPIRTIIDEVPIVDDIQLQMWQWVAQYYLCSLGEVMNAALPAHLKLMGESLLIWNADHAAPPLDLSDDAFIVAEALSIRKQLSISELRQLLEGKNTAKAIHELLDLEIALVSDVLEERYKPKKEEFVFLSAPYSDSERLDSIFKELEKAPRQLALLLSYFQLQKNNQALLSRDLIKKAKVSRTQLNQLIEKGILRVEKKEVDRIPYTGIISNKTFTLSSEQQLAFNAIEHHWETKNVVLLHGVTGSGKTLIYIEIIQKQIAQGNQVLFLLPEIALTTQIVSRLRAYFGEELGVYHSKFSNNERVEIWNKVKEKKYKLILGARSAVWLPFQNLGLIIVDEEHDSSYKQFDPAPRFQARDLVIYLASLHGAKVLLGSATPSLESTRNAQKDKYAYVPLQSRYLGVSMPEIEIVSAKNTQSSLSSFLTVPLLDAIQASLQSGKQVILFQNKRGYAPFLICSSCGWVAQCKFCDVSLTYHKSTDKLHCHYCGSKSSPIKSCPKCGSLHLRSKSFGTEKIEEELIRIFPKFKIGRMDWDSMRGKNKHSQLITDFTQGRIDILVGTQMVVKGLDFENVGLVGILSADSILSFPDFRVNERGFQMMEQVSGRAGRVDGKGKVIIQAFNLKHPVLEWVKNHDFKSFYQIELASRQQFHYPPFVRMIKLICRHANEKKAIDGVRLLAEELHKIPNLELQGPSPALIPRVRNHFVQEIWLKIPVQATIIQEIKVHISHAINVVLGTRGFSTLSIVADVDPT